MRAVVLAFIFASIMACNRTDDAAPLRADYPLTKVTAGVYVVQGPLGLPSPENQGFINNPGFVVTAHGVVVIDPGSSKQVGAMLIKKIRETTAAPVLGIFNTHIHGDHWLANDAIRAAWPHAVIYAHPKMLAQAKVEGAHWVELMMQLTNGAIKGTRIRAPDMGVDDGDTVTIDGQGFRIYHTGIAHTDGDIMIEVLGKRVLFLGDNLFNGRAPRLDDGSFNGNIAALDVALKTSAAYYVPGHGAVGGREIAENFRRFLTALRDNVKHEYARGVSDFDMKADIGKKMRAYRTWVGFDDSLGRLISIAYLEAEKDAFNVPAN